MLAAAVATTPKDPLLVSRLGRAQLLAGRSKEGVATLERAVALGETSPLTLSALADAQLAAGALTPAAAGFERLLDIWGSPKDAYGLASARARQGQTDQALAALERAMQLGLSPRQVEAARNDQDLSSLRGDARFEQNLSRPKVATRSSH